MAKSSAAPKKSHKMRKLVGLAVVAGAAYAAKKIMANKKATTVSRPSDSKKSGKK